MKLIFSTIHSWGFSVLSSADPLEEYWSSDTCFARVTYWSVTVDIRLNSGMMNSPDYGSHYEESNGTSCLVVLNYDDRDPYLVGKVGKSRSNHDKQVWVEAKECDVHSLKHFELAKCIYPEKSSWSARLSLDNSRIARLSLDKSTCEVFVFLWIKDSVKALSTPVLVSYKLQHWTLRLSWSATCGRSRSLMPLQVLDDWS